MAKFKTALLATLIVASPLVASPAFAWDIWNGTAWVNNGTVTLTGPTTATVAGNVVPCSNAVFTLTLTNGVPKVTAASFSGGAACTNNPTAANFNWGVSGTASGVNASVAIGGTANPNSITINFARPVATCSGGSATGTLTNAATNPSHVINQFTFNATFTAGPCSNVKSTGPLTSSAPIRL